MGMKGEKMIEDIQDIKRRERANARISYRHASTDPRPTVDKKNMWEKGREKDEDWSSRPQGSSENLFFSESKRYRLSGQSPCFTCRSI